MAKDANDPFTCNLMLHVPPEEARCVSLKVTTREADLLQPILAAMRNNSGEPQKGITMFKYATIPANQPIKATAVVRMDDGSTNEDYCRVIAWRVCEHTGKVQPIVDGLSAHCEKRLIVVKKRDGGGDVYSPELSYVSSHYSFKRAVEFAHEQLDEDSGQQPDCYASEAFIEDIKKLLKVTPMKSTSDIEAIIISYDKETNAFHGIVNGKRVTTDDIFKFWDGKIGSLQVA